MLEADAAHGNDTIRFFSRRFNSGEENLRIPLYILLEGCHETSRRVAGEVIWQWVQIILRRRF